MSDNADLPVRKIDLQIVWDWPPNIEAIRAVLPVPPLEDWPFFTWGNILYNPAGAKIPSDYMVHEHQHFLQQKAMPATWWKQYLEDVEFREKQEVEAYGAQLHYVRKTEGSAAAQIALDHYARELSAPMYGLNMSLERARLKISAASV